MMAANRSFMRLPLWVRFWLILALGGVNLGAFLLTHTPTGYWATWATAFVLAVNYPTILIQCGWGKVLAISHLIAWIPLLTFVALRLDDPGMTPVEFNYAIALIVVDGISILFDVRDSWLWLQGDREVP